jgi:hypothetical protein
MIPRFSYLIEPLGSEYNNTKNIAGVDIVVNTTIENAAFVNRIGVVVGAPNDSELKIGDTVVVHHNVFRTYLNMRGKKTKSNEYFRDDLYLVSSDRVFLYKRNDHWKTLKEYCFVAPISYDQDRSYTQVEKLQENTGTVYFGNETLTSADIPVGDKVGFTRNSGYDVFNDLNSSGDNGIIFRGFRSGTVSFIDRYGGGANYVSHSVTLTQDSNWHHFVLSFTNDNSCKIYMDGNISPILEFNSFLSTFTHTTTLHFGKGIASQNPTGITLDQVRIFDRAITAAEVTTLYNEVAC